MLTSGCLILTAVNSSSYGWLNNGQGSVNICAGSIATFDIGLRTVFRAYTDVVTKFSRIHWASHARAKAPLLSKLQFNYFPTTFLPLDASHELENNIYSRALQTIFFKSVFDF